MSVKWKESFVAKGRPAPYTAAPLNMDTVFNPSGRLDFDRTVVDESTVDFAAVDRQNRKLMVQKRVASGYSDSLRSQIHTDEFGLGVSKTAFSGAGMGGDVTQSGAPDFYSPWLSTDYLELPRSYAEERRWYRFFYDQDPLVGRAIDLKTVIPLSKMNLGLPKSVDHSKAQKIHAFYEQMWQNLGMYEKLIWIMHEYNLIGEALIYFEWDDEKRIWTRVSLLDPDLCEIRYMPNSDETKVYVTPDNSIREVIGDLVDLDRYSDLANTLQEIADDTAMESDMTPVELNTDPRKGSFVQYFGRRRSPYRPGPGVSVLRRLLRTILFRDKIRQALTQITSRHMTPVRLVWAEGLSEPQIDDLRTMVDLAIMGPDFSIVTNYQVNWEEVTAEGRLFDTSALHEQTTEEMLIGLGMTKELLLGEGSYGGGRITLQVLDNEYTLVRELITHMINRLFRVVAEKNGFVEEDEETGIRYLVYSTLKFTRMALRDYSDIFDFMWNMYQAGSLDRDTLMDFLNIDPVDVEDKLKRNFLTINDNLADEFRRALYSEISGRVVESTDVMDRVIKGFGLEKVEEDGVDEFGEDEEFDDFGGGSEGGEADFDAGAGVGDDFEATSTPTGEEALTPQSEGVTPTEEPAEGEGAPPPPPPVAAEPAPF